VEIYFLEMEKNNNNLKIILNAIVINRIDSIWYINKSEKMMQIPNEMGFIHVLPVLELSDISQLLFYDFPIKDVLKTALLSESEYWVDKALNQIVFLKLQGFKEELNSVEHDKRFSQRIRHLAKKIKYQSS
jgi:hypothetical protein